MKTPISRRIFFWTLFVSYFFTTSVVLFFVFGYRHDFDKKIFVHTGSITVKSSPQDIEIHLDGKKPRSKLVNIINDSYYVSGLRAHAYDLTVTHENFKPWTKEVSVHSGVSTEFWNVNLLRNHYERTTYDIEDSDRFFPAPQENIFAFTRQLGKAHVTTVFDTKKDAVVNTFLFTEKQFTKNPYDNIEWSPSSEELIVPLQSIDNESKDYAIAYTQTNESQLLSEYISQKNIQSVRWDPKDKNVLYFLSEKKLFRADLDFSNNSIKVLTIATDVLSYDFADDGIYLFTTTHDVLHDFDIHGTDFKKITSFDIPESSDNTRLIAYDNLRVIIIDDDVRDIHLYNKTDRDIYSKRVGSNIIGAHFSDDGKKLLYHSPFEIFVYFTRDWNDQPRRAEDEMHPIIRFSQLVSNVHFAKDYEHIIFTVGNDINITELDYRGNRITDTITTLSDTPKTLINKHKMNRLFFIDSTENKKKQFQSIEFPEKETLF